MRPLKTKPTSKAAGIAGVRLLLKSRLWWRCGFPFDGQWLVVPNSGSTRATRVVLTRSDLSKATYALKKLLGELPKSLAIVVGKTEPWEQNTRFLLESIKKTVHKEIQPTKNHFLGGECYSKQACHMADRLWKDNPVLRPLLEALSWLLLTEPQSALSYLRCVERETKGFGKLLHHDLSPETLIFCVQVLHLGAKHGQAISIFVSLASAPHCPFRGGMDYIGNIAKAAKTNKRHSATFSSGSLSLELRKCTPWLLARNTKEQARFFSLLSVLELPSLLEAWSRFWPNATALAAKIDNIQQSYDDKAKIKTHVMSVDIMLTTLRNHHPPPLHEGALVAALRWFSGEAAMHHKLVTDALAGAQGFKQAERAYFLIHWHLFCHRGANPKRFAMLVRSFAAYVAHANHDISPWREMIKTEGQTNRAQYTIDSDIAGSEMRISDIPKVLEAFTQLRTMLMDQRTKPALKLAVVADEVVELVRFTHDAALAAELALSLCDEKEYRKYYSDSTIEAALAASAGRRERYVDLLRAFSRLEDKGVLSALPLWDALNGAFSDHPILLIGLLLDKDHRKLLDAGEMIRALASLDSPLQFACSDCQDSLNWLRQYPPELHIVLLTLSLVSPEAESIAKRVCKGIVRNSAALNQEYNALTIRVSNSSGPSKLHQEKRLRNILCLLESDEELSSSDIDGLNAKLQSRAGRELLQQVYTQSKEQLALRLKEYFGVDSIPKWMLMPQHLRALLSSLELKNTQRKLARRLFLMRLGPPPWDLREDTPNRLFLLRMKAKNINTEPWLDNKEMECSAERGTLYLRLADDPLEVFQMGAYFKTCLSPDGINFFSVFANAADINKRVLYAYNDEKKVIGRQLLCLSNAGTIIAFHLYSHDSRWEFLQHASTFVSRLSKAMNTTSSVSGDISLLVAGDWYDDGAVDSSGILSFLEEGSSFSQSMATTTTDEFTKALYEKTGEIPMEQILPKLFGRPDFVSRPELMASLMPELRMPRIGGRLGVQIAGQLDRLAIALPPPLIKIVVDYIKRSFRIEQWLDVDALAILSRDNPILGLRLLRQTRNRGVRSWTGENQADRLVIAGKAMLALRRKQKAMELFYLATKAEYDDCGSRNEARDLLRELGMEE